ncbi:hypothetical protein [Intrasporangium sp.]|uniref:hypothetical protein n=1 Tax=Intrasporangium sp. TaxID=1925024 RepID=UPI003365ABE3
METLLATPGQAQPSIGHRPRSRPRVAAGVACLWAVLQLGLALGQLAGLDVTPWSGADPSVLSALSTSTVAVVVAVLAGVSLAALATWDRRDGRPARIAGGLLLATGIVVALALADVRSLTLLGYLPMVLLHHVGIEPFAAHEMTIPTPVLLSLMHSVGGVGLLLTGLSALTGSLDRVGFAGGADRELAERRRIAAVRVGRWAVGVAVAAPLVYASTRVAWAFGIPLGVSDEFLDLLGDAKYAGLGLGLFAIVGSMLTLGLVQRWGEAFWSWVPRVGGRPVPVSMAVVPALFVAMAVISAGIGFAMIILGGEIDALPGEPVDWAAWAPEVLWVPWGIALGVAALAYRVRREATTSLP